MCLPGKTPSAPSDRGLRGYVKDIKESSDEDSGEYIGDERDGVDDGESDGDEGVRQDRD